MLFTDRPIITLADIEQADPSLAVIAATEDIPTDSHSFIQQAIDEAAATLLGSFQQLNYQYFDSVTLSQSFLFPFYDSTPPPRISLNQIVVNSNGTSFASPLKRWIVWLAIRNFYQDISNRLVNDRYTAKLKSVQSDIDKKYWPALKGSGLPVCFTPFAAPASSYLANQGTFTVTQLGAGASLAATYDVAITYTKAGGIESGPSPISTFTVAPNNILQVDISNLIVPSGVTSWTIYAGTTGGTLYKQINTAITTMINYAFPILSGTTVGVGQAADTNLTFINLFARA